MEHQILTFKKSLATGKIKTDKYYIQFASWRIEIEQREPKTEQWSTNIIQWNAKIDKDNL